MIDTALTQLLYLAIAVYAIFAVLHYALSLLDIACSYLSGSYWWWTFRRFSVEVIKRLILLVILVKVAEWAGHMGHLW
jgi:hypothetical protein